MLKHRNRLKKISAVLLAGVCASFICSASSWAADAKKAKPVVKSSAEPATMHSSPSTGPSFFDSLPPPEGVRLYDIIVGPRLGIGSYASATMGFGLNGEYLITRDIGVGGFFGYSTYSLGAGSYSNMLFLAQGSYHANLFKVKNLDTFATLGIGYDVVSVSGGNLTVSASGIVASIYINGRYFFNEQWSGVASLGYGVGVLGLGVDYKF